MHQTISESSEYEEIDEYKQRAFDGNGLTAQVVDSVATVLDQQTELTIEEWLERVGADENLSSIELDDKTRSCHLPQLYRELVHRLRFPLSLGTKGKPSKSAHEHGLTRRKEGCSTAVLVEESRMLPVSIFDTLRKNVQRLDLGVLFLDVMVIANEVDLQLA